VNVSIWNIVPVLANIFLLAKYVLLSKGSVTRTIATEADHQDAVKAHPVQPSESNEQTSLRMSKKDESLTRRVIIILSIAGIKKSNATPIAIVGIVYLR